MDQHDLAIVFRALSFAADKHRDQRRKDDHGSPYINHPIDLARVLCDEGGVTDTQVLCAALLHDTVEDTDTRVEELEGGRRAALKAVNWLHDRLSQRVPTLASAPLPPDPVARLLEVRDRDTKPGRR